MAFTQKPHGRVTRDPEQGDLEASFIQWHVVYFGYLGSGLLKLATGFWAKILDLTCGSREEPAATCSGVSWNPRG